MRNSFSPCAFLALAAYVGCSVYDESLLPSGNGGTGGSIGTGGADTGGVLTGGITGDGGIVETGDTGGAGGGVGGTDPTGGSSGADPVTPACEPPATGESREYVLISDTETDQVDLPGGGYWFTAADTSSCITGTLPEELSEPRERDEAQGGGESVYAMHIVGVECGGWGANTGFRLQQAGSYNACEFEGIAFWARIGHEDSSTTLQVEIPDVHTDPAGAICDVDPTSPDQCHAYHFRSVTLSSDPDEWTFIELPFSSFVQPNWGYRGGELQVAELFQVQFKWPGTVSDFDVWIDDVYFYRGGSSE